MADRQHYPLPQKPQQTLPELKDPRPPAAVISDDPREPEFPSNSETSLASSFDPSRMIGIIRRKALIKDLAAVYHAECLQYCQQLLELQRKLEEPFVDIIPSEEPRKEITRPPKRVKKVR